MSSTRLLQPARPAPFSRRTSRPPATCRFSAGRSRTASRNTSPISRPAPSSTASRTIRGHNRLLGKVEGVDGIKTGYTRLSGFNLLTSVNTDTRSIVAVVLGGRSGASRDQKMAALIDDHLPRAYAGARIAPPVVEGTAQPDGRRGSGSASPVEPRLPSQAPVRVASATPQAPVAQATTPQPAPERKPLDLNTLRPVVASATGASSTTTPPPLLGALAEGSGAAAPERPGLCGPPAACRPGQIPARRRLPSRPRSRQSRRAGSGRHRPGDQDRVAQGRSSRRPKQPEVERRP